MKSKRKIKVRAYGIAGTVGVAPTDVKQLMVNSAPAVNALKQDMPVSTVGSGGAGSAAMGALSMAPDAVGLLAAPFLESTATTGGEAAMLSVGNIAKGAATGMAIAGPWGALAGGLVGAIGSKGRYAKMASFTDYDEGTFSTGLRALGGANKRRRRERARVKANAYDNRDAVRGTSALEADYAQEYDDMGTDTFALGGSTNSLAYVDDGELLRTPDGQISKVPERGKPTDSNLVNIPDGTRILSDSLKVPGTNKTFAQIGEKMIKNKKSKNKDIFALNAAKLNLLNNELIYNLLFLLLEQVKAAKGIRPKSKLLIPAAEDGLYTGRRGPYNGRRVFSVKGNDYSIIDPTRKVWHLDSPIGPSTYENFSEYTSSFPAITVDHNSPEYKYWSDQTRSNLLSTSSHPMFPTSPILSRFGYRGDWSHGLQYTDLPAAETTATTYSITPVTTRTGTGSGARTRTIASQPAAETTTKSVFANYKERPLTAAPLWRKEEGPKISTKATPVIKQVEPSGDKKSIDWGNMLSSLAALPGIISDLNSKPEHFDAVYNPYASDIRDVMSGRRYDISAAIAEGKRNRAVSNYNANQFNTNTGANLAYRLQSARNYDNYVAKLRDTKNNIENQYAAEYANTMNDLGKQWVNATNLAVDQNARSRAAARNIQRQGFSELAQLGQTLAKSSNERRRDKELLPLYREFLKAGFSDNDMALLMSNLPKSYRTKKK